MVTTIRVLRAPSPEARTFSQATEQQEAMARLICDTDAVQPEDKCSPVREDHETLPTPGPAWHRVLRKLHQRMQPPLEANAEPRCPHGGSFCAPRNHCLPQMQEAKGRGQALLSGPAGNCPPASSAVAPTEQQVQGVRVMFLHIARLS